jgi:lipid II:glycine glycyltransferase (peptidoglycan interpeptide bridge formation enzyme)
MDEMTKRQELAAGYTYEVNRVEEREWCGLLEQFDDTNIYQTWSHAAVISGAQNLSHVVVKKNGEVIAIVQARIAKVPGLRLGIAYIRWGPLWRRNGQEIEIEHFRQALRAIRQEFVLKQGLVLRIFPIVIDDLRASFSTVLAEEGFSAKQGESRGRTILMDLSPALADLREGMRAHWKRELKVAEKAKCEILEGTDDSLFADFITMYKEMVSRKKFVEPNDIHQFREIQSRLPAKLKMKVMLTKSNGEVCAGLICSAIGDTAVYLFGATSNAGLKSRGSYLLHWKLLEQLQQERVVTYNLNGINPEKNPGTYKFKNDLAGSHGQDVLYAGRFDAHAGGLSRWAVNFADGARARLGKIKSWRKSMGKMQDQDKDRDKDKVKDGGKVAEAVLLAKSEPVRDSPRPPRLSADGSSTLVPVGAQAHEREAQ